MRGSFDEIVDLAKTVLATTLVTWIPVLIANPILVPKSVPIFVGAFALVASWRCDRLCVPAGPSGYPGGDWNCSRERA